MLVIMCFYLWYFNLQAEDPYVTENIQYNLNGSHWWLVYHGWFELFFQSLQNSSNSSRKQIFREFFLFYHGIVCWVYSVYSLESPHRGDSNVYTQHTIILLKIENTSLNCRYLFPELVLWLTLSGSNYPCLERSSMVPKMFEPLKFDCICNLELHQK